MSKQYARRQSKTDPKGDRRSRSISAPEPEQDVPPLYGPPMGTTSFDALLAIAALLQRGDGWLRLTATLDMKTCYLKYKWNAGNNRGTYVMAVVTFDHLAWGLTLLLQKTRMVDAGDLNASEDTFYDWT